MHSAYTAIKLLQIMAGKGTERHSPRYGTGGIQDQPSSCLLIPVRDRSTPQRRWGNNKPEILAGYKYSHDPAELQDSPDQAEQVVIRVRWVPRARDEEIKIKIHLRPHQQKRDLYQQEKPDGESARLTQTIPRLLSLEELRIGRKTYQKATVKDSVVGHRTP